MLQRKSEHKAAPRKGVAIVLATFTILMFGGLIGLAIDGGIAFFLKARLGQAMDAAALSGARSLARGTDVATQAANAQAIAKNYFSANFPNNFWACTVNTPTVAVWEDTVNTHIRYVQVTGSITTPLYFMRVLGFTTASLSSTATAQRRDVNVVIVLDRSGSMSAGAAELVSASTWFVNQFSAGRDKVGLVTFGGTYYLIKPSTTFTSVPTAIATLTSSTVYGTTNHAQPLWTAYKALAEINEPSSLNVLVFFTDGEPNTIYADWRGPSATSPYMKSPTTCNNGFTGTKAPYSYNSVFGYALVYSGGSTLGGLFGTPSPMPPYPAGDALTPSPDTTATDYVNAAYDKNDSNSATWAKGGELISMVNSGGCNFYTNNQNVNNDFSQIPALDYYGNATNPAKTAPTDCSTCTSQYKSVTLTSFTAANLTAAAFNAGDTAAQRMRKGVISSIIPMVDCIALNDGSAIDSVYMGRLANISTSSIYNNAAPTGSYYYITNASDLQPAFQQIASQILHLSQ